MEFLNPKMIFSVTGVLRVIYTVIFFFTGDIKLQQSI
jgi:hypothetical protein